MKIHGNQLLFFFNVQKHVVQHTFKLKNISVYYYLQKTLMAVKEGQLKC